MDKFTKIAVKDWSLLSAGFGTFCSECGDLTTYTHYHCSICESDDFDLCQRVMHRESAAGAYSIAW